ncbi:MAG: hypothetical protein GY884_09265 [Proteobacteria bacterium]|nr:hypothetical protein [Pseudomonadota bacterium]
MLFALLTSSLLAAGEPTLAERPMMDAAKPINVEQAVTAIRAGAESSPRLVFWRIDEPDAPWKGLAPGEAVPEVAEANTMAIWISRSKAGVYVQVSYRSMGDVDQAAQYFFAPEGRLLRFTMTSSGFGDVCGEFRVDLAVDYPTPTRGVRTFDQRQGDGTPSPPEFGCQEPSKPWDPNWQPLWFTSGDLPNKGVW